jgi:hypothetical protein
VPPVYWLAVLVQHLGCNQVAKRINYLCLFHAQGKSIKNETLKKNPFLLEKKL